MSRGICAHGGRGKWFSELLGESGYFADLKPNGLETHTSDIKIK